MTLPNIFGIDPGTADVIGFAGMACIVLAYGYITGSRAPNPFIQHGVNLLGAALLAVSLTVNTNMASLVLEAFWAAIAIWGLAKAWRNRSVPSPSRVPERLKADAGAIDARGPPPGPPPAGGRGEA